MLQLINKVIFLTGGAQGIGEACAVAYVNAGAKVFIIDRSEGALNNLIAKYYGKIDGVLGEVQNGEDIKKAINKAISVFGKLDVIHNNAGIASPSKTIHETLEEEWDSLFAINLKSVFWTAKYGVEELKKTKGCIINTSSMVGEMGQDNHAAYVATKGGMNSLTKAMALDYAKFGVRVNAICPAGVWTPLLREWSTQQPDKGAIEKYLDEIHPLGYCPEGDVIADAAVFLASDAARFITGSIMPVSGGAELGYKR
jgi:meso-butanediol dehydrogenase / (S,S)-butanediol dehydrogenase / diacetyl reductase